MFIVQYCHHGKVTARVHSVQSMNADLRAKWPVATDPQSPPVGFHRRHLLLLSPKAILIYHPTEGRWLSRPRWLATYRDALPTQTVTHPRTNRARRRATTLIEFETKQVTK